MVLDQAQSVRDRVRQSAVIRQETAVSVLTFHAMGTRCRVCLAEPSRDAANQFLDQLLNWVADFEAKYSRFLETSLVSRINAAAGKYWIEIDPETEALFALCAHAVFVTHGVFDPTALPLIRLWNWRAQPPVIPSDEAIASALELVGWHKVQRRPGAVFLPRPGMAIDLGGVGKEYAVDVCSAMAARFGVKDVLVDFGQDIRAQGSPPDKPAWHVGLEDPQNPGSCWGSIALTNHAVATSGDYLRHFIQGGRRYGHIVDPRSGQPVHSGCHAVTVVAPNCTLAGLLSTSAFCLGTREGHDLIQKQWGASGALLGPHGRVLTSRFYEHLVQQN